MPKEEIPCLWCGGSGWVRYTDTAHDPDCNGYCDEYGCPVGVEKYERCQCWEDEEDGN